MAEGFDRFSGATIRFPLNKGGWLHRCRRRKDSWNWRTSVTGSGCCRTRGTATTAGTVGGCCSCNLSEASCNINVTSKGSMLLRSPTGGVASLEVGTSLDQQLHHTQVSVHTGDEERRPRIRVLCQLRVGPL